MELGKKLSSISWWLDGLAVALWVLTFVALAGLSDALNVWVLLLAVAWLLAPLVWLGRVLKWCFHYFYPPSPSRELSAPWRHFGLLPLLALSLCGLATTDWPLRVVFGLHRPALERFAQQAMSQKRPFNDNAPAQRVGLYTIRRVQKVPGGVRFATLDSSFMDVSYSGLVFYPSGASAQLPAFPAWPYQSVTRGRRLDSRWLLWDGVLYSD